MESSPPSTSSLEDELASLIRVRNRLAQSSDSSLPKVLTGLLPRLFVRLEHTYQRELVVSSDSLRAQIRGHLFGILTHALERIRGNTDMPTPWLPSILVSLESDNQVVRTLTLSFVQAAMPRCDRESAPIEALLRTMDRCHRRFIRNELSESGRMEWRMTSWLLMDAIAVVSGLTPMIDWDLDSYTEYGRLGVYEPPQGALATAPLVSPGSIKAMDEDGVGVWDLILDVLLFWPSMERVRVPRHDAQEVVNGGVSVEGRRRMAFRLKERSWNDVTQGYLQYLKTACFRFAVSKEHPCIFQGDEGSAGATRALMLSVLLMNSSKVGKLASDYLNIHFAQMNGGFAAKKQSGCSLSLACSILLLVLGDAVSAPIIDQYPNQKNVWTTLMGPRPFESAAMRPPLSHPISARAIEFISNNLLLSGPCSTDEEREAIKLFVDLAVSIQNNHTEDGLWAIRLIYMMYKQMTIKDDDDWTNDFHEKCLSCARDTLSALPDPRPARPAQLEDNMEIPAAVPLRNWRRTEDELFTRHRSALRKKRLQYDDAVNARKNAYALLSDLGSYAGMATHDKNGDNGISFDLAIVLFKCAVIEETMMKPRVTEALDKLLAAYKSFGGELRETCTQHQVAFLIPSLVDAACCECEAVRLVSAKWTVELLVLVDPEAAYCLCCFLANDADYRVTGLVKSIVQDAKLRQLFETHVTPHTMYEFLDLSTERDLDTLTMDLNLRIASIARALDIPSSAASVLLLSFDGSPKAAIDACVNNREGVFQLCGVRARCETVDRSPSESNEMGETFVCGICYDDEITSSNSYAMSCGHRFCMDCWQSFLENKLEEGPTQILNATCPSHACTERITGVEVKEIIPQRVSKWKECLLRQFVDQESHYRFCPGPDCHVVIIAIGDTGPVTCGMCDASFCFGCGESPHIPAHCDDFDKWKAIFGSSQFWVAKHAKPCPGCNVPIEKNQGCNHILCSRCHTDFCWLCLARLDTHLMAHTCNRYDPAEHAEDGDERKALFFTERFQAHEEAEMFARKRVEGIEDKVQHLLDKFWLLSEEDALERVKAEETLVDCRRFLKNSYVAAYGMKDDRSRRKVFESHQGALELLTETLSGLTELSLDNVYVERGENALRLHLRAISFYTSIVRNYMERIANLDYVG